MKVDATVLAFERAEVTDFAQRCERIGFDGLWSIEVNHDPFFPLLTAAAATERIELGTGIAVAFPRSPMHLAYTAWDLQVLSGGRFILGLGSQVRAHITKRFGSEWSHPAPRMREIVLALRAIWQAWQDGGPFQFRGEFTSHTLMPPAFSPGPSRFAAPPIHLAAVQARMIEVAGEVADGLIIHPLHTERYLRETLLPAVERGLERGGRAREAIELSASIFAVTNDEEAEDARRRIAFYGSTPAYRFVLEAHGYGRLADELHRLSRTGGWFEMPGLIGDDLLETVAVVGSSAEEVGRKVRERYGGLVERVNLSAGDQPEPEKWAGVVSALQAA